MLQLLLAVFIGGGTGSVARWLLSMRFNPLHQAIPLGTLAANLIGAFIIGMGFAWFSGLNRILNSHLATLPVPPPIKTAKRSCNTAKSCYLICMSDKCNAE